MTEHQGFTLYQIYVMFAVETAGALDSKRLSERTRLPRKTIAVVLQTLRKKKLLTRVRMLAPRGTSWEHSLTVLGSCEEPEIHAPAYVML